jgi:hypothetical protein
VPRSYRVRLSVGDWSQTRSFELLKDPRNQDMTEADLIEQFELRVRIRSRMAEAYDAMTTIRSVRAQLSSVAERAQDAGYVDRMADTYLPTLDVMMIYRLDRFGRGGHHRPFADLGFPAVRIMETNENYNRQHQDIRFEDGIAYGDVLEGVDFDYAAKLTALNTAALASLAWAPGPPMEVRLRGANRPAAILSWEPPADVENIAGYRVHWRLTDSSTWDSSRWVGDKTEFRFEGLIIDNYFFGVSAVSVDGHESVVVFPTSGR